MKKKTALKDIAEKAGVSIGTVDRVIHNRGRVSEMASEKVNNAIKELDYTPNPIARSLRNNTVHEIHVLIPDPKKDSFWLPCQQGISKLILEFKAFDLNFTLKFYDPSKPKSFSISGNKLLKGRPDAFLFVPLFDRESDQLLKKLRKTNILTATFSSPPRKQVDGHVGQDLFLTGRVAAKLMQKLISDSSQIAIVHIDEAVNNSVHMQQKEKGFRSFFGDLGTKQTIFTLTLEATEIHNRLKDFLDVNPEIDAFFITTSKAYMVTKALECSDKDKIVVGYDLLPENIEYLENGKIQFLIHQAPKLQASLCLRAVIEKLLFNKDLRQELLLPIEIVNSENVKSYL